MRNAITWGVVIAAGLLAGETRAQLLSETATPGQLPLRLGPIDNSGLGLVGQADFDGDGRIDLLAVGYNQDDVWLSRARGGGVFGAWTVVPWPSSDTPWGYSHAVGDFDSDGHLDVFYSARNANGYELQIAYGNGQGGFPRATTLPFSPTSFVRPGTADLEQDGDDDIIYYTNGEFAVLRNDGRGNLTPERTQLPSLPHANAALIDDFDGDGDVDLLAGSNVFENLGGGRFDYTTHLRFPQGGPSAPFAVGDLNGDGRTDLLGDLQVYLQNAQGEFVPKPLPSAATSAFDGQLVDVDRDGDLDVFLCCAFISPELMLNNGVGSFAPSPDLGMERTQRVEAVDVDRDGDRDLIVEHNGIGRLRLFLSAPNAPLLDASVPTLGEHVGRSGPAIHTDIDNDGDVDVIHNEACVPVLYRNDGAGRMRADHSALPPNCVHSGWRFADFDGDGDQDLMLGVELYENDGSGNFLRRTPLRRWQEIAEVFDYDQDGDLDVVGYFIHRNDGNFSFTEVMTPWAGRVANTFSAADFDRDGITDLFIGARNEQDHLWSGTPGGGFVEVTAGNLPVRKFSTIHSVAVDFDHDGDVDLLLGHRTGQPVLQFTNLLRNNGSGRLNDVTSRLLGGVPEGERPVAHDFDGDGDVDLLVTGDTMRLYEQTANGWIEATTLWTDRQFGAASAVVDLDSDGDEDLVLLPGFYAPAKVLSNRYHQLHAPQVGSTGTNVLLDAYGQPGEIVAAVLALRQLPKKVPTTYGSLGIDLANSATLATRSITTAGEPVSWQIPIPPVATLIGLDVFAQAAFANANVEILLSNVQRIGIRQ